MGEINVELTVVVTSKFNHWLDIIDTTALLYSFHLSTHTNLSTQKKTIQYKANTRHEQKERKQKKEIHLALCTHPPCVALEMDKVKMELV